MEQTPEHILQMCPHSDTAYQAFWLADTDFGTKLWGPLSTNSDNRLPPSCWTEELALPVSNTETESEKTYQDKY